MTQLARDAEPSDAIAVESAHVAVAPSDVRRGRGGRGMLHRAAIACAAFTVVLASLVAGLKLRVWAWEKTGQPQTYMRFNFDIENAHHWGSEVMRDATARAAEDPAGRATDWRYWWPAFRHLYERVESGAVENDKGVQYQLDYTPARLFTMALWVRHERVLHPRVTVWLPQYEYNAPLMWLNNTCELLGCLAAFLLVRLWVQRGVRSRRDARLARGETLAAPGEWERSSGWILGLLAAVLLWFNPAIITDAHVWPQWEVWIIPAYLFGLYFASRNGWLLAGLIVGAGAQMKGQITMVSALFILWPIFERRPMAALRFIVGAALAVAVLLSPWLLADRVAVAYVLGVAVAACAVAALCFGRAPTSGWWVIAPVVAGLILWPWLRNAVKTFSAAPREHALVIALLLTVIAATVLLSSPLIHLGRYSTSCVVPTRGTAAASLAVSRFALPDRVEQIAKPQATWQPLSTGEPCDEAKPALSGPYRWAAIIVGSVVLIASALLLRRSTAALPGAWAGVILTAVLLLSPPNVARRARWYWFAGVCAAAVFLAAAPFHASFAWYRISYEYPTRHWEIMSGQGANLPGLLSTPPYLWRLHDHVWDRHVWTLPWVHAHVALPAMEIRTLLGICFFTLLTLASWGVARKHRRGDPRILIAFTTPWLLMFALMPQMHERYIIWGVAASVLAVGCSGGFSLMHLFLTAVGFWQCLMPLLGFHPGSWPAAKRFTAGFYPGVSWAVLLATCAYLYETLRVRSRRT